MKNQNRNGKGNVILVNWTLRDYKKADCDKTSFYKNKEKEEQYGSLNQVDTILADYVLICSSKYINLSEIFDISECKATVAQSGRAPVLRTGILADIRVQSNSENPGGGALIYTQIYDTKNLKLKGNKEKSGFEEPVNSCANAKDVIDEELFKTYENKKEEQYGSLNQVELSVHDTNNIGNEIYKSFAQSAKPRSPNQVGRLPKKQVSVHDIRVQISDGNPVRGALTSKNSEHKTSSQISEYNTPLTFTEIVGGID